MRVRVVITLVGLVGSAAVVTAAPSSAAPEPSRSGAIVGGTGLRTAGGPPWKDPALQRSGCEHAVDCTAWLRSGCAAALSGHDPALTTSIVDVGDLADGRTRRALDVAAPHVPPWGLWPGVVVQLWRRDCTEVPGARRLECGPLFDACTLRIPDAARWMTVTGHATTAGLTWTLS